MKLYVTMGDRRVEMEAAIGQVSASYGGGTVQTIVVPLEPRDVDARVILSLEPAEIVRLAACASRLVARTGRAAEGGITAEDLEKGKKT